MHEWQIFGIVVVSLVSVATIAWNIGVWSFKRKMVCNGKLSQFMTITMCGEKMEREQISKDEIEKHAEALREAKYDFKQFQNDMIPIRTRITKIEERLDALSSAIGDIKTILTLICSYYRNQFPDFHIPEDLLR